MEEVIKLDSKGSKFLKKLRKKNGGDSKTYVLKGAIDTIKTGYNNEGYRFISFIRGPVLIVDQLFQNNFIKSIDYIENYGYTITFK